VLLLILVPATGRDPVPARKPKPNDPGSNDPAFGVCAHAVQRVQHGALSVLDAGRRRRDGDHQTHAQGKAERDEDGLAHAAAKFTPQVSKEHPALLKGDCLRADGGAVTRPGSERRADSEA
jgi:hypothetical protein